MAMRTQPQTRTHCHTQNPNHTRKKARKNARNIACEIPISHAKRTRQNRHVKTFASQNPTQKQTHQRIHEPKRPRNNKRSYARKNPKAVAPSNHGRLENTQSCTSEISHWIALMLFLARSLVCLLSRFQKFHRFPPRVPKSFEAIYCPKN